MTEIRIQADNAAQLRDLLAAFQQGAQSVSLTQIADAIARGNNEQSAQLEQMRLFQIAMKAAIMITYDQILSEVRASRGVVASVEEYVKLQAKKLDEIAAGADPATQAKLQELSNEMMSQRQALADAIDDNPDTPAKPTAA